MKAYKGFLDRPIERLGIEPDVEVHQSAEGLARGHDAVLHAAREYLNSDPESNPNLDKNKKSGEGDSRD